VAVELDGDSHATPEGQSNDRERDNYLTTNGILVLRFWNGTIHHEKEAVLDRIAKVCEERAELLERGVGSRKKRSLTRRSRRCASSATSPRNRLQPGRGWADCPIRGLVDSASATHLTCGRSLTPRRSHSSRFILTAGTVAAIILPSGAHTVAGKSTPVGTR